jgi:hypothetical protein
VIHIAFTNQTSFSELQLYLKNEFSPKFCIFQAMKRINIRIAWGVSALVVALVLSCNPKPKTNTEMSVNKTPYVNTNKFENGPSLDQPEEVEKWAEARQMKGEKSKRHFRLPIYVDRDPLDNFLNPKRYYAGVESASSGKKLLELRLDDGRLGISLDDRIREYAPADQPYCILQIEATWGPLMEQISAMNDPRPVITLITVSEFTGDAKAGNSAFYISAEK